MELPPPDHVYADLGVAKHLYLRRPAFLGDFSTEPEPTLKGGVGKEEPQGISGPARPAEIFRDTGRRERQLDGDRREIGLRRPGK
jgi:hypothetical protein